MSLQFSLHTMTERSDFVNLTPSLQRSHPVFHLPLRLLHSPSLSLSLTPLTSVGANGWWGAFFTSNGQKKNTQMLAIATGCFAGATESVVVTPFELVKIRLQDKKSTFTGPADVIRKTIKTSGVLG